MASEIRQAHVIQERLYEKLKNGIDKVLTSHGMTSVSLTELLIGELSLAIYEVIDKEYRPVKHLKESEEKAQDDRLTAEAIKYGGYGGTSDFIPPTDRQIVFLVKWCGFTDAEARVVNRKTAAAIVGDKMKSWDKK